MPRKVPLTPSVTLTVHMCSASKRATDVELFPDPKTVIANWNSELEARLLPVLSFDLALAGQKGRGVMLYYEDVAIDYLEWKSDGERIVKIGKEWRKLRPMSSRPELRALRAKVGRWMKRKTYTVTVPPPSAHNGKTNCMDYTGAFEAAMTAAGAEDPLRFPRIGDQYPCYVQDRYFDDDSRIVAELYGAPLDLQCMYFYLCVSAQAC